MKVNQLFILLAAFAGIWVAFQGAINGLLARQLSHPLQATFVSFLGGTLVIALILVFLQPEIPSGTTLKRIPWYLYTGGAMGVFFVTVALLSVPRIGATQFLAAILAGQVVGALLIDHFGLLEVPVQHISWKRIGGVLLIVIGVFLTQR